MSRTLNNHIAQVLVALIFYLTFATATGIIVPLYEWPGDSAPDCTPWAPLISAIAAQPSLTFFVIINPSSGPGGVDTQPDPVYAACMEQLEASNVIFVGYVDTARGGRASSEITQDIATYAGWESAYAVAGIFFDDVEASEALFSNYSCWASTAQESFNDGDGMVILNPGTNVDDNDYFTIADQIMTFESEYCQFSESDLTFGPDSPASQQSVIVYATPSTVPTDIVSDLTDDGIGSLYLTDLGSDSSNPYASFPDYFATFVATVAADQQIFAISSYLPEKWRVGYSNAGGCTPMFHACHFFVRS